MYMHTQFLLVYIFQIALFCPGPQFETSWFSPLVVYWVYTLQDLLLWFLVWGIAIWGLTFVIDLY